MHPERQAVLDSSRDNQNRRGKPPDLRFSRHKPAPFEKEFSQAKRRKEEQERRNREIEEANRRRQSRREEHQRFRKALEKARQPDRNGQRRLGRESKLLPQMVESLLERLKDQHHMNSGDS